MTLQFATAIADCFKDEDDRELEVFSPIDLDSNSDNINDIILAMYDAVRLVFLNLTSHECDCIDFMAIITHLLLQDVKNGKRGFNSQDKEIGIGDEADEDFCDE